MKSSNIAPHSILNDKPLQALLDDRGYCIAGNIGTPRIQDIRQFYEKLHHFKQREGGMFYSLYSDDLLYRKEVHDRLNAFLQPVYDTLFSDYKVVLNSFIVKVPGPHSDFTLHQDSTGLDEKKYSPISAWIPLQDTTLENGTLCVVPKTHRFFHPYRGISFRPPFAAYENELKKYLVPIELKAGDILLFDYRLVHYSHINSSGKERIIVMSGLFPKEADILSVYRDESVPGSPLEIYRQTEDFLITNTAFYKNCTDRPCRGELIEKIYEPLAPISYQDFLHLAQVENLTPANIPQLTDSKLSMQIISEPV